MRRDLALMAAGALAGFAAPALACDCVRLVPGPHHEADLDRIAAFATVVADGVIEQPLGPMLEPAIFRPTRVLTGVRQDSYRIGIVSDCGLPLRAPDVPIGVEVRLVLYEGPEVYEASRCVNFQGAAIDAAIGARVSRGCGQR